MSGQRTALLGRLPRRSNSPETALAATNAPFASPSAPVDGIATNSINPCTATVSGLLQGGRIPLCDISTTRTTAFVTVAGAALSHVEGAPIRYLALTLAAVFLLLHASTATAGSAQPGRIARISRQVFGPYWRTAACIAHYESTDGKKLYNGYWRSGLFYGSLGPWQIEAEAHRWADPDRLVSDWVYAAKVAYRLSSLVRHGRVVPGTGGSDWSAWTTHRLCGV